MSPEIILRLRIYIFLQIGVKLVHDIFRREFRRIRANFPERHLVAEALFLLESHVDHRETELVRQRRASRHGQCRLMHEIVHGVCRSILVRTLVRRENIQPLFITVGNDETQDLARLHIASLLVLLRDRRTAVVTVVV